MTKDEALRLALEALNTTESDCGSRAWEREQEAITAIKEALANEALDKMAENARELGLDYEPAQEPVAWAKFSAKGNIVDLLSEPDDDYTPLYTTPPQRTWVGLTNDEVNNFAAGCHLGNSVQGAIYKAEAKLKEKNNG
jgi:hypothetical protein